MDLYAVALTAPASGARAGGIKRRAPVGGTANGTPSHTFTSGVLALTNPVYVPLVVRTARSGLGVTVSAAELKPARSPTGPSTKSWSLMMRCTARQAFSTTDCIMYK